ncbi:YbaK/EbsC family protein [Micromonospora andamanensis]|uniref:YbaK/aminoacyl-tRNA synthetase-associated domain-containing protein n=1 Tax=Micromonospora andamanensis TaxID=1287068 RepID=A0ABQ4HWT6_9ACTN|nr:YbaK/EbsC family protein [Micromonospora andamanensis]GIJ10096.1 hypothetical protein Van01_33100 [Micromonospora andamanensis]
MQSHPNVRAVQDALDAANARNGSDAPATVRLLPDAVHTADGTPLLVLTSGAHRVDTTALATRLTVTRLRRATPQFVKEHTGQVIGGVAPVGHPQPLRTLVDTALDKYDEIWAAGGVPQAVFPTTYAELLRVTGGTPTDVA